MRGIYLNLLVGCIAVATGTYLDNGQLAYMGSIFLIIGLLFMLLLARVEWRNKSKKKEQQ